LEPIRVANRLHFCSLRRSYLAGTITIPVPKNEDLIMRMALPVVVFLLVTLGGATSADEKSNTSKPASNKPPAQVQNPLFPNPPPGYERRVIRGFVVWINKEVIRHNGDSEFRLKPLDVLDRELETIVDVMYDKAVDCLRTIL